MKWIRKQAVFLSIVMIGVLCSSCSNKKTERAVSMKLEEAQLTEEEKQLEKLITSDESHKIYQFTADEQLQSVLVNSYELDKDGEWKQFSGGGGYAFHNRSGRIGLSFHNISDGIQFSIQSGKNTVGSKHYNAEKMNTEGFSIAASFLSGTEEILYEKEIPVVIQIITSKNEVSSFQTDNFFQTENLLGKGYEKVYAVTITFSKKPLS